MDDPLRPKTVPLAAETVLWFEFLLDPQLITKHLNKQNPEPSALELITQFIAMTPDVQYVPPISEMKGVGKKAPFKKDGLRLSRKQLALKILALKVATWLKWNLDVLEKNLPITMQIFLLRDLCTISFGKLVTIPLTNEFKTNISVDGNEKAARFALAVYHRVLLRFQMVKENVIKLSRPPVSTNIFPPVDLVQQFYDTSPQPSIDFLLELCQSNEPFYVFSYDTFVALHPSMNGNQQHYDTMHLVSQSEIRAQVHYDLTNYYLYTKQYQLARDSANACLHNLTETTREYELKNMQAKDFHFCHMNKTAMDGILLACGISSSPISLLERFNMSLLGQFKDIVEILKLDNRAREIPIINRRNVELDIEGAISQGHLKEPRSLEVNVAALNVVRSIFERGNIFASVEYFDKYREMDLFPPIVEGIQDVLPHCNDAEITALKCFLIDCIVNHPKGNQLLEQIENINIFSKSEIEDLKEQTKEDDFPVSTLASLNDWKCDSKLPRIDVGAMERQLISCTNANTVRKLLVKLAGTNPSKPLWTVNPSWEIATPLKSLLMSMQRGFLQDFAYVLLGKARELTSKGDYIGAVSMLSVLKSETQRQELSNAPIIGKLGKLVNWEILHIQITQTLEEWTHKPLDLPSLTTRCKQCLSSLQNGDNIIPRIEIIENCALMLLNLTDWQSLMFLDKRLPQLELPLAFATTFIEMEKMKGPKKICRDAWEIVLSMFLNTSKRGGQSGSTRNSPCLAVSTGLQPFLKRIRHQSLFSLAISMLGKIHNILKDDPNHDLNGEYMQLWPTTISNPIGYSIRSVCETLHWLLTEALKFYPQTISWLKMKGDLELAIGNNEAAMRCYVNALITGTEYCTIPLQRNIADDYIIRKMIRCSANLGCHMQATVLCQFLDEIDYGIVFKNLSEKSSNFTDAMDAYYNCIWDTTLLEFIINLHAKRGEHSRKLEAISIMGTLELNANNNDEIKREAASIRKSRFLRALAKQYLL